MDPPGAGQGTDRQDELACQRRKRLERRLESAGRGQSCASPERLWTERRLRMLEHLQTLLLED